METRTKHFPAASPQRRGKPQMRHSGPRRRRRRRQTRGEKGVVVEMIDRWLPSAQPQRLRINFTTHRLKEINGTCGVYTRSIKYCTYKRPLLWDCHEIQALMHHFRARTVSMHRRSPLRSSFRLTIIYSGREASKQSTRHRHSATSSSTIFSSLERKAERTAG